jgi:hypothetical protein
MTIHSIPIASVRAEDSLFDIFHRCPSRDFVSSIRQQGILQPVYCVETTDGFTLIAGFKRLRAAWQAELHEIPAVVLPVGSAPEQVLETRLQLDSNDTYISIMAQAALVKLASELLEEPLGWLCSAHLRQFFPMSKDKYDKLRMLANSGKKLRKYFRKYDAPMTVVSVLLRQTDQLRERVAEWAFRFRIRPIELEKMLNNIVDCAKRAEQSSDECWEAVTSGEPKEPGGHERAVYLAELKNRLNDMRYPYLASQRKKCTAAVDAFKKECGAAVVFDTTFESGKVTVSFPVSNEQEFTATVTRLASESAEKAIEELFTHE